ncbi:MAG: universal stress protein [Deltaproteobacteria bacterium]|nr:MAG: universal stress protein [Deltaproteobacteria bacterium]
MFDKILYPTDFSNVANKAMNYITKLKEAGGKEVIGLHVIDERAIGDICLLHASKGSVEMVRRIEEEAWKEMDNIGARLRQMGFRVKLRIERGIPLTEILRVEQEEGVSPIVIGSHGKSNVEEMLLGSVSEKVIRKSGTPVLVVKR